MKKTTSPTAKNALMKSFRQICQGEVPNTHVKKPVCTVTGMARQDKHSQKILADLLRIIFEIASSVAMKPVFLLDWKAKFY